MRCGGGQGRESPSSDDTYRVPHTLKRHARYASGLIAIRRRIYSRGEGLNAHLCARIEQVQGLTLPSALSRLANEPRVILAICGTQPVEEHTVMWKGSPRITAGHGGRLNWRKLRLFLRDAEPFSFRFTDFLEERSHLSVLPDG